MKDEIKETVQVLLALMVWPMIFLVLWIMPPFVGLALLGGLLLYFVCALLAPKSLRKRVRRYW
jgi:hypothetical protein